MVKELYEKHVFIYIMLGLCVCGMLLKVILDIVYTRLIKASDNMGTSKNKLTQMMKRKFETCYKLKIGVNNVDIFVDKYVYRHRFGGILLSTWESIGGQILMLCLLTGSIGAVLGLIYECGKREILSTFSVGILTSGLLIFLEGMMNGSGKKELIRLNMKDYLENFFKVRLEQELLHPELIEQYKKELLSQEAEGPSINISNTGEITAELVTASSARINKKLAAKQRKEAIKLEKQHKKLQVAESKEKEKTDKRLAKTRKQEEIEQKRIAAREMQERIQKEAKQALEKKREAERAEIAQKKAEIRAEEERKKEEKYRQEEIRKALLIEKQSLKEEKQKRTSEHKTIAQERKESLKKEVQKRRSMEGHEAESEPETAIVPGTEETLETVETLKAASTYVAPANVKAAVVTNIPDEKPKADNVSESPKAIVKPNYGKKIKQGDPTEEKLIEDILKEFLA